ncbi:MAG TPA: type III restriction endonuclease subunit R [Bacteroidota bacterium]|nr:type III restriction endonuclease subunit R [Bacteroidota bacterium]
MTNFEVPEPIINKPYEEPQSYWQISEGEPPKRIPGRRPASYYYKPARPDPKFMGAEDLGTLIELKLVNRIRDRIKEWRTQGYPGVSRTTLELLNYWKRDGRGFRLFFAQMEAVETIIFLKEARKDFHQGIDIPIDDPGDDSRKKGYNAFTRYACKMATGSGKTTVMGMLAAWSILNKVNDRSDNRFSDVVLVVCPNITIKNRLAELDPKLGEASIYRTRDLVPSHLAHQLTNGRVVVWNWHVFEPQTVQIGGVGAKVSKAGVPVRIPEYIYIGPKTTSARGKRYLSVEDYTRQVASGMITVLDEENDEDENIKRIKIESWKYVQSDTAIINRVLGNDIGGKQNILVFNDEAHHAYRIRRPEPDDLEDDIFGEAEASEDFFKEANVWMEGLDRLHKNRGINFCVDLSATPYFLARVGQETNRPFPWVVSDFGLTDAIESGLVKIPQLAVRDTTGKEIPGYFNIWRWILPQLTPAERGAKKESPKPEAILKYANAPVAMLAGLWEELRVAWEKHKEDQRSPVFIIVCKNTKIAKVIYEWIGENKPPHGIPPLGIKAFQNNGQINTIRVDTKVISEGDSEKAKSDETSWMRHTLNTVGKLEWPKDKLDRPIYPEGFEELAKKLDRPLEPPGKNIRCIVSVSMLTEGWDCSTVTHIIGLRPFMSQLLCEQVVGRGLRRASYEVRDDGLMTEEVAKVFGVPFEIIPFKENKGTPQAPQPKRHHIHAVPQKANFEIPFPRVEGYRQAIRNRVVLDSSVASLQLDPFKIPPEVQMKAMVATNKGRPSLMGPGKLVDVSLNPYREGRRFQELVFELARDLTRSYVTQPGCEVPVHALFPQFVSIVREYLNNKVEPVPPAKLIDVFLSPYYGWVIERLVNAIKPDTKSGEAPEVPQYELNRGPGSTADVDLWTSRDVREVVKSHLNYVVADTKRWEQSAAYIIDTHPAVDAFVKNAGLGFSIPYLNNGQPHDYVPDFIIRLKTTPAIQLILETKGYDELVDVKRQAANRWVNAVNADGTYGVWSFDIAFQQSEVRKCIDNAVQLRP